MKLEIHKGKSFSAAIALYNEDGTPYNPESGVISSVLFGVKSGEFGELLISKTLQYSSAQRAYILSIDPEDTEDLLEGVYDYDISYTDGDGGLWDIIPADKLVILRGVVVNS